jgi:hypothetical protein
MEQIFKMHRHISEHRHAYYTCAFTHSKSKHIEIRRFVFNVFRSSLPFYPLTQLLSSIFIPHYACRSLVLGMKVWQVKQDGGLQSFTIFFDIHCFDSMN